MKIKAPAVKKEAGILKLLCLPVIAILTVVALSLSGCEFAPGREEEPEPPEETVEVKKDIAIRDYRVTGGEYFPGDQITAAIEVENHTGETETIWVGCSIENPLGHWYDLPAEKTTLDQGETATFKFTWEVPDNKQGNELVSGSHDLVMALWPEQPGKEGLERLDETRIENAFTVFRDYENFTAFDKDKWEKSSHRLGLGELKPENVNITAEMLQITLPAGTLNGGQLETRETASLYGSYRAKMKLPNAPSSITGFFLYRPPDYYYEIDIEVVNDPSGKIWFTTYAEGERSNTHETYLDFDPTKDFYEYRFDFYPGEVSFYVDGELLKTFEEGLPEEPMKLMINSWFPRWLEGITPENDRVTLVEWIKY